MTLARLISTTREAKEHLLVAPTECFWFVFMKRYLTSSVCLGICAHVSGEMDEV